MWTCVDDDTDDGRLPLYVDMVPFRRLMPQTQQPLRALHILRACELLSLKTSSRSP